MNNVFNGTVAVGTGRASRAMKRYRDALERADEILDDAWEDYVKTIKLRWWHKLFKESAVDVAISRCKDVFRSTLEVAIYYGYIELSEEEESVVYSVYSSSLYSKWTWRDLNSLIINAKDGDVTQVFITPSQARFINYWSKLQ